MKCDETKPHCLRCQKFGRTCDGYLPEPTQSRGLIQLQPRIPSVTLYNPTTSIHATEEESRYFQVFCEQTSHELSGYFDDSFWTRLVLQESHNAPSIRHAVIAIGALNKSLESAPGPHLKVNVIQSTDKKHHEQAVFQHLKAIQALNQYISQADSPQLRTALIACYLFVCFEIFQGSYASSVQQTYGGLKILRSYYAGKPGSRPWIPQRAIPAYPKEPRTGYISKALQIRLGCDNVSKERAMAMHLEEYLEHDNSPPPEESRTSTDEDPLSEKSEATVNDPRIEHGSITPRHMAHMAHMGGTDFAKEQHPNMALYTASVQTRSSISSNETLSLRTSSDASSFSLDSDHAPARQSGQPSLTPKPIRKGSAALSTSSVVSTLVNYTPPSTGPHTPSPSYAPPTQPEVTPANRKRPLISRTPTPPVLQNDLTIEESLIQTFVRLDGQGLFFGMIPGIPPLIWDIHKVYHLPIPSSFPNFHTAHRCWDFLMDRALQFYRRISFNRAYAPASCDSPASIRNQHASYIKQLSLFSKAFEPILASAVTSSGSVTNAAALIISLQHKCTLITLAPVLTDSEMVYDDFLPEFQYITRTCGLLIKAQDDINLPKNPRFTFDIGIVPPLHMTATKCRDPVIRREAVEILFSSPRQEGMWDGVLSARIGRWIAKCEEAGLAPPPVPVRNEKIFDFGEGGAFGLKMGKRTHEQFSYPSPPDIVDEMGRGGGWEAGRKISETVNEMIGRGRINEYASRSEGGELMDSAGLPPISTPPMSAGGVGGAMRKKSVVKGKGKEKEGWFVPEENRVQLVVVDFHIPDRYIKVKCHKALPREDGTREEMETVLGF